MSWDAIFNGWSTVIRTVTVGVLAYVGLVLLLRVSGKRTLSRMNAFDWVVTVALGSTLATILLSKDVSLVQGGVAFGLLIFLQYIVAWSSVRFGMVRRVSRSEPRLLALRGSLLETAMEEERVSLDDLRAALRSHGLSGVHQSYAVVLETNGSVSVVKSAPGTDDSALDALPAYNKSEA